MKFYTGVGSRKTPTHILKLMQQIASKLAHEGWTLRSGAAHGADQAFERGCRGNAEVYLPWPFFNSHKSHLCRPTEAAYDVARLYHPTWDRLKYGGQKLMARNTHQVLGADMKTPSKFVICWHQGTGGTTQACRIAIAHSIPVFNLNNAATRQRLEAWLNA